MTKYAVFRIGRADSADIQLTDPTISRLHAEILLTADGRFYLTDCQSSSGTSVQQRGASQWSRIQQSYVDKTDRVLLGQYQTSVEELVLNIKDGKGAGRLQGLGGGSAAPSPQDDLPEGPVRRDLSTGEVLKQED
jgi:pSer/pThr/pTyr-binding forkhead associated (FHA) protein